MNTTSDPLTLSPEIDPDLTIEHLEEAGQDVQYNLTLTPYDADAVASGPATLWKCLTGLLPETIDVSERFEPKTIELILTLNSGCLETIIAENTSFPFHVPARATMTLTEAHAALKRAILDELATQWNECLHAVVPDLLTHSQEHSLLL